MMPPTSPEHMAGRRAVGHDDYQTAQARRLLARHAGLSVIDARGAAYPRRVFIDDIHLDGVGASIFSSDLGDALARGEAGGLRWMDLPAFRDRPDRPRVEDWEASRLALAAEWRARR